ncbi:unnamed protein product [Periconia digitata]|uniref:Epoxide hydrolase N-terminal domain-containing protein n=1 Tax=Periconia digitata TaxID=1303443 RepID=A0A9W4XSP4_9PLEO|nr:unnamed protein product [Periconia digitata]
MLFSSPVRSVPLLSLLIANVQSASTNDSSNQPQPYTVDVDPAFIEKTRQKVANFRPTIEISGPDWYDGPPLKDLTEIAEYWTDSYNWSTVQSKLNSEGSQYMVTLPPPGGKYDLPLDVYFRHHRSNRTDAIPLLMVHGWPSTSMEWEKVTPDLVNPANASQPAFHVVAPDLPGFGFSPAAKKAGLGPAEHATLLITLMETLGYSEFGLYSTDLGVPIAQDMVVSYEPKILNHISDMLLQFPNDTDTARYAAGQTTPEETTYLISALDFFTNHTAYSALDSSLPLSLSYALNDSPLGFFAWMYQLFFTVNDNSFAHTPSEIITQALLLYIPGVYGNLRSYKELYNVQYFAAREKVSVPVSVLQYGGTDGYPQLANFNLAPRDWVERNANVTYFSRHERGGHFPAVTVPDLVVDDIRASFVALGY